MEKTLIIMVISNNISQHFAAKIPLTPTIIAVLSCRRIELQQPSTGVLLHHRPQGY